MKKTTLSILTTVIALSPLTAFAQQLGSTSSRNPSVTQAQDAQTSIQTNTNSAAAVGDVNLVLQDTDQSNYQQQLNLDTYGVPATPNAQTSVQSGVNEAAAVGAYNIIDQQGTQTNVQDQVDVNQYIPSNF